MFGDKLTLYMQLLDTDYDNYMIGYECYDNMRYQAEGDELEAVHMITVGIATSDPNASQDSIKELEKIATSKVPGLLPTDMATVLSGNAGKCNY